MIKAYDTRLGGLSKPNIGNCSVALEERIPWDESFNAELQTVAVSKPASFVNDIKARKGGDGTEGDDGDLLLLSDSFDVAVDDGSAAAAAAGEEGGGGRRSRRNGSGEENDADDDDDDDALPLSAIANINFEQEVMADPEVQLGPLQARGGDGRRRRQRHGRVRAPSTWKRSRPRRMPCWPKPSETCTATTTATVTTTATTGRCPT